jgi:hypothetical protein
MLQMLIHLFFRNGQELGELQGGVRLLLEQLFQGLAYRNHVQPATSEGFGKVRLVGIISPFNDKNSMTAFSQQSSSLTPAKKLNPRLLEWARKISRNIHELT